MQSDFSALYGGVQQVKMIHKNSTNPSTAALQLSYGRTQKQHTPLPRAVVEFRDPASAAAVLAARKEVPIVSMKDGVRTEQKQFVLKVGSIGHLKQPCSCRLLHRMCTCAGYVK